MSKRKLSFHHEIIAESLCGFWPAVLSLAGSLLLASLAWGIEAQDSVDQTLLRINYLGKLGDIGGILIPLGIYYTIASYSFSLTSEHSTTDNSVPKICILVFWYLIPSIMIFFSTIVMAIFFLYSSGESLYSGHLTLQRSAIYSFFTALILLELYMACAKAAKTMGEPERFPRRIR